MPLARGWVDTYIEYQPRIFIGTFSCVLSLCDSRDHVVSFVYASKQQCLHDMADQACRTATDDIECLCDSFMSRHAGCNRSTLMHVVMVNPVLIVVLLPFTKFQKPRGFVCSKFDAAVVAEYELAGSLHPTTTTEVQVDSSSKDILLG